MIILDTNVVSEVMRRRPEPRVVDWLDGLPASSVWVTTVTVYEVEFGLQCLPKGKRRDALEKQFRKVITEDLEGRVLSFDAESAVAAGAIGAARRGSGEAVDVRDLMIAGIARVRRATVATRNVSDFESACEVVNPWGADSAS